MPSYVVAKMSPTKDGSSLGASVVMVVATTAEEAKKLGAEMLECSPSMLTAEPYIRG
jgi:hypothetical protein